MFKFDKRFNKNMSELDNLSIRLRYAGGGKADDRMQKDKLRTLKKALLYSYQAETIVLEDGREFRALINPDKLKNDYDNKILSIPFKDICLNAEKLGIPTTYAEEPTNIQVGDVFQWKETETYWIVYLKYLEESAYFRGEIRQCTGVITIDGKDYRAYVRGPVETAIRWNQKSNTVWNDLNYSKIAYVGEDELTSKLKRFDIVKMDGDNYQVQVVNKDTASDGILIVYLKEYFTNTIEEENLIEEDNDMDEDIIVSSIQGKSTVKPYDITSYSIDIQGGEWSLSNNKAKILSVEDNQITIEIITGKAGTVDLTYEKSGIQYILPIVIESF